MKLNKVMAAGVIATLALSLTALKPPNSRAMTEPLAQYSSASYEFRPLAQYSSARDLKSLRHTKDLKSLAITLSAKSDNNGFDEREDSDKSESKENTKENNGKMPWTTALLWLVVIAGALEVTVLRRDSSLGNKINERTKNFREGGLGQSFSPGDNPQGQASSTQSPQETAPTAPSTPSTPPTPINTTAEGGDNVEQQ